MPYARGAQGACDAAQRWDITTPTRSGRLPGVSMAGFRDRATDPLDLQVVPFPAVTVAVAFGDGMLVDDASGRRRLGGAVLGLPPGSVRVCGRDIECLQIRLSPVVAHAVLAAAPEASGMVLALDDLWGREAARIQEQLGSASSWEERFALAEAAIARGLQVGRAVAPEVAHVWRQMVASRGRVRVDVLADEVGWSRKRLWARFRSQIGLTPKRAAQLVRFDDAAHRLAAGRPAALVAAESGFADQSHLNRDVTAFTGAPPKAVAAAPWLAVDDVAWATPSTYR